MPTTARKHWDSQPDAAILRAHFDNMEAFAAAVRCEVTQLAPGGAAEVARLELASGSLEAFSSSFEVIARGTRPAGLVTFMMTRQRLPGFALNGQSGRPDCLWAYAPGAEVYGASPRRSELTLIAIPESRLGAGESSGGWAPARCRTLRPPPDTRLAVTRIVAAAFDLAQQEPAALHDPRRRLHIESDLVEHLSLALQLDEASPGRRSSPSLSRQLVLRAVDEQLDTRRDELVRVDELSAVCGLSVRTLHNVYREAHGVSAMEYVRLRRLNAVRRMLARADPDETTVSESALSWGFWHPGAFSVLYRKTFGERPSETLRRRHS